MFSKINITKISVTGPESCGKTTLAQALAKAFDLPMVPEHARSFMELGLKMNSREDLLHLCKQQIESERQALSGGPRAIICDTDILVLYIWCKEKFPPVPGALRALLNYHHYDFTLVCSPDLAWDEDPFRENPKDRDRLFQDYLHMLNLLRRPYGVIRGYGEDRLTLAKKLLIPILK